MTSPKDWVDVIAFKKPQRFDISKQKYISVTVFKDHAEVKQLIVANLGKGNNEIRIENLPMISITESVLVYTLNSKNTYSIKKETVMVNNPTEDYLFRTITFSVDSSSNILSNLLISYQVLAGWTPSYEIRMNSETRTMKMTVIGKIRQKSGLAWLEAPISLSSYPSICNGSIPEISTLHAKLVSKSEGVKQSLGSGDKPKATASDTISTPILESFVDHSTETTKPILWQYKIPQSMTILSDNDEHKVLLGVFQEKYKLLYTAFPLESSDAILNFCTVNRLEIPLLAGPASFFLDNCFIASAIMGNVYANHAFCNQLGVDPAVKVQYKLATDHNEKARTSTILGDVKITVKNQRKANIWIALAERIPQSDDEQIKTKITLPKLTDDSTSNDPEQMPELGAVLKSTSNTLVWTVEVEGNEKKKFNVRWLVEHPSDKDIMFT